MASRPVKTLPGPLPIPPHLTGDIVKWEQAISKWGHACNNGVNGGDCCGETMCEDYTCHPPHGLFQCACGFTYCGCCYARSPSDAVIRVGHAATRRHALTTRITSAEVRHGEYRFPRRMATLCMGSVPIARHA